MLLWIYSDSLNQDSLHNSAGYGKLSGNKLQIKLINVLYLHGIIYIYKKEKW